LNDIVGDVDRAGMSTRRSFLLGAAGAALSAEQKPLEEFRYSDVKLAPGLAQSQFEQTQAVLLSLNEDSLLKPWRLRAGLPAPGPELGGWYDELPLEKTESGGHGFAPGHCFGQWISALARGYAAGHDPRTKAKLEKILALYEPAISGRFYKNFRFPAYNYDKLVIGLIDAQYIAGLPHAGRLLELTTNAAEPHLPPHALDRDEPQRRWRASIGENTADDYTWDESYTIAENLYLAYQRGAGDRYKTMARRFLLDKTYFDPLSEGKNVLGNHHAYSFCNALSSAMAAYMVDGSEKHLRAASNAFDMISNGQSFATGGWGPNEAFVPAGSDELYESLSKTRRGFETPCGSYAHFKLARYLLRVTGNGKYGDSMERVLYNTVLGAKPLQRDGRAFYYSDYQFGGSKTYFPDAWPCCSGTLPQVAADYRILTYFRDPRGLFVNLYLPSTLNWVSPDGAQIKLTQTGDYPAGDTVSMRLACSRTSRFALRLRVPAWAEASFKINGVPMGVPVDKGFASLDRKWKNGDQIQLQLASQFRLEPINARHPNTVALVKGPLVYFAIGEKPISVARDKLLSRNHGLTFRPFTAITDEHYSAYVEAT
jgi:DUF1680 family protein